MGHAPRLPGIREGRVNALDRLIAYVAPGAAMRRIAARHAIRHYEAATTGRRLSGRTRARTDANGAMLNQIDRSAEAARDLVRNNPWAAKIVSTTVNNAVGYGITSEPQHPNKVKARKLRALWDSFASSVDVHDHRRLDWYGIQQLAMRAIVESGGVLLLEMTDSRGLHVRVLEQDYIDRSKGVQGVEYGPRGPQFYWLYDSHPGDSERVSTASSRYPAERVAHIYRIDRPGQNAGITWLAPVVLELHDLDGMEDATLLKQKTAACFGGFIEQTGGLGMEPTAPAALPEKLEPGGLDYLPPGTKITFPSMPTAGDYAPFVQQRLKRIAAGVGISYEALTGDLSQVNYSSGRMGWQEFQRNIESWQWQMLIPMGIQRFCDWFVRWAVVSGQLSAEDAAAVTWQHNPPRRAIVDPAKEYPAIRDAVRAGLLTLPEALRDMGKPFDPHMEEIKRAQDELDRLGIAVESDARRKMNAGDAVMADPQGGQNAPAP